MNIVRLDYKRNKGNLKSLCFILLFRLSKLCSSKLYLKIIGFPIRLIYRLYSRNFLHVEIWDTMQIGSGFVIYHGAHGSVINPNVIIGKNVTLRQNTTIGSGSFTTSLKCPIIGNNVEIGPNVVILGNISIGDNSQIGGGAVVVNDVPENAIVAGNPANIIKTI